MLTLQKDRINKIQNCVQQTGAENSSDLLRPTGSITEQSQSRASVPRSSQLPAPSSQLAARSPRAVTPSHTPSPAPPPALRHLGWFSVLQPTKCHLPGDTYKLAAAKGTERKGPGKEGEAGQGREERGEDAPGDPQRPSCFVPSADPQETALSSEPTPSPGPHFQARPGQS